MSSRAQQDNILASFFRDNYLQALREQEGIEVDYRIVHALCGVEPWDEGTVKRFMAKYNLLRNCSREDIAGILAAFHRFWKASRQREGFGAPPRLARADLRTRFEDLLHRLYKVKERNWISATSKLLWCMYPRDVVIYDRFVHSSLTTLQPLEPALRKLDRIGANRSPEEVGLREVTEHYMRAWDLVQALRSAHAEVLGELWRHHSTRTHYPWEIRVVDRLLVYLGDPGWGPGRPSREAED